MKSFEPDKRAKINFAFQASPKSRSTSDDDLLQSRPFGGEIVDSRLRSDVISAQSLSTGEFVATSYASTVDIASSEASLVKRELGT